MKIMHNITNQFKSNGFMAAVENVTNGINEMYSTADVLESSSTSDTEKYLNTDENETDDNEATNFVEEIVTETTLRQTLPNDAERAPYKVDESEIPNSNREICDNNKLKIDADVAISTSDEGKNNESDSNATATNKNGVVKRTPRRSVNNTESVLKNAIARKEKALHVDETSSYKRATKSKNDKSSIKTSTTKIRNKSLPASFNNNITSRNLSDSSAIHEADFKRKFDKLYATNVILKSENNTTTCDNSSGKSQSTKTAKQIVDNKEIPADSFLLTSENNSPNKSAVTALKNNIFDTKLILSRTVTDHNQPDKAKWNVIKRNNQHLDNDVNTFAHQRNNNHFVVNNVPAAKRRKRYFKGLSYSFNKSRSKKRKRKEQQRRLEAACAISESKIFETSDSACPTDTVLELEKENNSTEIMQQLTSRCVRGLLTKSSLLESSEDSAGKTGSSLICLCQNSEPLYARKPMEKDVYCQAMDSMEGKIIGCCNTVDTTDNDIRIYRPGVRVPFLIYCDPHIHRLLSHQCCPVCGLFCTQGRFLRCKSGHIYHHMCEITLSGGEGCPHCGLQSSSEEITIVFGDHKNPVFLPSQKAQKDLPSAKISLSGSITIAKPEERPVSPPIVPPKMLVLSCGKEMSLDKIPFSDKDKLEQYLLNNLPASTINSAVRYKYRDLYYAAKTGNIEKVLACLAAGINPNHFFRDLVMGTALHAASAEGYISIVHILVQAGAQLDILDKAQNTPLMLAAENKHNDIVKYFVKAGASVTLRGEDGMTALHFAARAGNIEACYYLLSNPTTPYQYVNSVDDGGWTALVWAAEHNHLDVVLYLLSRHADPLIEDSENNIALHWSAYSGSVDICETLLNYNSDVNSVNSLGDTPLHICARQNLYGCVVLLLARGARTDIKNKSGLCALDCCIEGSDSYNALKLNIQLKRISSNFKEKTLKILINDISKGYEINPIPCVNGVDDEEAPKDFIYITENCFTSNISVDRNITSLESCTCTDTCNTLLCTCTKLSMRCWYTDDGKLSTEFNFLDPPMLFECNVACKCNKISCKNRIVQHGITARFQLFRTDGRGWGIRTVRLIPKGTYVCEYIGEIISDREADTREDDSYIFDLENREGETYCIDAFRYGNISRFINHCCEPNLVPVRVFINNQDLHFPRIAFFANRDIQPNEELGYDYGEKFWSIKYKKFTCTCKAEKCRYSNLTITNTLEAYRRKLQMEDALQ